MRLVLINPNTTRRTTDTMVAIAREAAGQGVAIDGMTAAFGTPLITTPDELTLSVDAVLDAASRLDLVGLSGIIVGAFGDPGLGHLRAVLPVPVTGLAEAGMLEAAAGGRRFAVATTTPRLVASIEGKARLLGLGPQFTGVYVPRETPRALMSDPERLHATLARLVLDARAGGAEAVVIGGGPLATAARALQDELDVPIVAPVPAAVRFAIRRARDKAART
ncbi:aspartate/glutamate racemase family protein [Alsobacter sp. R-9]